MCCSVLQCVVVCCSVLQCVSVCCSVSQCVAVCHSELQCVTVYCGVLWRRGDTHAARYTLTTCALHPNGTHASPNERCICVGKK